jgi:hypothetical protein
MEIKEKDEINKYKDIFIDLYINFILKHLKYNKQEILYQYLNKKQNLSCPKIYN